MIVFLLGASLFVAGVYDLHSQRDFFPPVILKLAIGAIGTGVIVAVFEETVFRGALLQGLQKKVSIPVAIVMTSLVYTWIHFIHFAPPADLDAVGFFTAPMNFFSAYTDQMTIQNLDAVISIFVLGVLLAMIRVKQGNLFGCIALHAGLVAGIKIFRYLLEYQPDNSYQFLVSSHDYRLGFMATLWLFLATLVYCFLESRVRSEEDCAI
jgi:membrane protease YdiL (CAAX protease family)